MAAVHTINMDKLREIAVRGAMRAAIFMGIAANVAKIDPPVSHALDDHFRTVIVPEEVDEATKKHFIEEFEKSVVANGLRELIETFSIFLNEVHRVTTIAHIAQAVPLVEAPSPTRAFDREGVDRQLERLHQIFGAEFQLTQMFNSLVTARNCMTHNRGIVRKDDCEPGTDQFDLHWLRLAGTIQTPEGEVLAEMLAGTAKGIGTYVETGGIINMGYRDFVRSYKIGELIEIERQELAQICQGVIAGTDLVGKALMAHLTELGVPQVPPKPTSDAGGAPDIVDPKSV